MVWINQREGGQVNVNIVLVAVIMRVRLQDGVIVSDWFIKQSFRLCTFYIILMKVDAFTVGGWIKTCYNDGGKMYVVWNNRGEG